LTLHGVDTRRAHALVGARVLAAERAARALDASDLEALGAAAGLGAALDAPLDAAGSVRAKRTVGSTHPQRVAEALDALEAALS
jgi:argininosuccinate lyase